MSELFETLENATRDQLIPALVEREVSDAEGQILALPLRHGGLGLINHQETAKKQNVLQRRWRQNHKITHIFGTIVR